ncbi:hypothetical protein EB118_05990 [bacterium]|nr:hypothetical protein [bacterium]NBX97700.1 hypothetical protein [bacterium]NDC94227.1 hypothetical protein [bacterium]NDD84923.1 hypothetical protein [bacterium]NDG29629.1 hypothetical protein [bacterium]
MSEQLPQLEQNQSDANHKKRMVGRGALVFASGWISNATWASAIAFNRIAVHNDIPTLLPAIGFAIGTTATEYGMTYLATSGDIDMTWEPKRKVTSFVKKISQKIPLITTAWRGAASGVYLDALNGSEVTSRRRLTHAGLYGSIVGAWASEPGNKAFSAASESFEYLTKNPIILAGIAATALAGGIYGYQKTEGPNEAAFAVSVEQVPDQE